jgi:hypothetical protein
MTLLVVCGLVELLMLVDAFFIVYGIFLLFVSTVRTLSGYENTNTHEGNVSEKSMMRMQWVQKYHWYMRDLIYPSSTGTLTHVKPLATFASAFCHRVRTIRISELLSLFW